MTNNTTATSGDGSAESDDQMNINTTACDATSGGISNLFGDCNGQKIEISFIVALSLIVLLLMVIVMLIYVICFLKRKVKR